MLCIGSFSLLTDKNPEGFSQETARPTAIPNEPISIAQTFFEAYYREDSETLYAITCTGNHNILDEDTQAFSAMPTRARIDFSQTRFEVEMGSDNKSAYVTIWGITRVQEGGTSYSINWEVYAQARGYDDWGVGLRNIDGRWLVCN
jgi:hypothetical protein